MDQLSRATTLASSLVEEGIVLEALFPEDDVGNHHNASELEFVALGVGSLKERSAQILISPLSDILSTAEEIIFLHRSFW